MVEIGTSKVQKNTAYFFFSKPNMNYDKLSRALRYYYDKNIMTKVTFLFPVLNFIKFLIVLLQTACGL